jgi:hypothetical protein
MIIALQNGCGAGVFLVALAASGLIRGAAKAAKISAQKWRWLRHLGWLKGSPDDV